MWKRSAQRQTPATDVAQRAGRVFTGNERESILNEIVNEIRKDALKQDALNKSKKATWLNRSSTFLQHPVVLLIIGFVLTSCLGARLADAWQLNEWNRQQQRLIEVRGIDLKYGIIEDITKAVGERNAAARGVMYPIIDNPDNRSLIQEELEPVKNWQRATYNWLVNSEILKMKIMAHIRSQDAVECFDQIIEKEKQITGKMAYIKAHLAEYSNLEKNEEALKELDSGVYNNIYGTGDDLNKLVAIIIREVQADVQGR